MKDWESPDWDDNPEWTKEDFARARPASEVCGLQLVAESLVKPGKIIGGHSFYISDSDLGSAEE